MADLLENQGGRPAVMDPATFRAIVSGERRGLGATCLRGLLRIAEVPYTAAVRWRNRSYDRGKEIHSAGVPVVSVGNLTLGGTGKTPMVAWFCRHFRQQGQRVAIVSRGYGAAEDGRNDEALELEQQLPDVPHVQNADRVAAARVVTEELECNLIVLDDGFQHRRLHRDVDVVLLDALEPLGHEHVFPRGTLREPISGLARADAVILSRSDMMADDERTALRERVARLAPQAPWAEVVHAPRALLSASGSERPLAELQGQRVAAFSGIGNPAGFRHTLQQCGYQVTAWREFPDHHRYSREDIDELGRWVAEAKEKHGAAVVLCTHKDLVKIGISQLDDLPLWAVAVGIRFRTGEEGIIAKIAEILGPGEEP